MAKLTKLEAILATIRDRESGGNYAAHAGGSSASGAYQFTRRTWIGAGGGKYAQEAYLATPAQQDEIAGAYVQSILDAHDGDPNAVPQVWYVGHYIGKLGDPALDFVPHPEAGNTLTVAEYVKAWIQDLYKQPGAKAKVLPNPVGAATDAVGSAVAGALGAAVEPFTEGLRRLTLLGLALGGGLALVVAGAWRSVKSSRPPAGADA